MNFLLLLLFLVLLFLLLLLLHLFSSCSISNQQKYSLGNNDLFHVCANLMSNLVITAHDEGQRKELKEQMARQVWRDGTVECIMHVLRNAHDPTQLM